MIQVKLHDSRAPLWPRPVNTTLATYKIAQEAIDHILSKKLEIEGLTLFEHTKNLIAIGWKDQNLEPVAPDSLRAEFRPYEDRTDFDRLSSYVHRRW